MAAVKFSALCKVASAINCYSQRIGQPEEILVLNHFSNFS